MNQSYGAVKNSYETRPFECVYMWRCSYNHRDSVAKKVTCEECLLGGSRYPSSGLGWWFPGRTWYKLHIAGIQS